MVRLIGPKKIRTAVFISGTGSNLKSLIKFSLKKISPIEVNLIVSDNVKAKGLEFSKLYRIKKKIYNYDKKRISEKKILKDLKSNDIKLICLAGFMKILSKDFITYKNPGTGIPKKNEDLILGKKANRDIEKDILLNEEMFD